MKPSQAEIRKSLDQYLYAAIRRLNELCRPGDPIRPHNGRSRDLEEVITIAFQDCDVEAFKTAVDKWAKFFKPKPKE